MKFKVSEIVSVGVLSCLVLIGSFINIMLPFASQGGLVHFGTTIAVISVVVYGRKVGTLSGAIGMSLFDILGGWLIWAPATAIARLGLGYIMGTISYAKEKNGKSYLYNLIGLICGGAWMVLVYYLFEAILYNNWIAPLGSIPGNVSQLVLAAVVGIPIGLILKKYIKVSN
ncbi:putative membrane protein [Bacilli bacterium PM5-3]|nr:putative membrane protein [Bacilli bacterium PM5-3]MDH6603925.1 putative membrane protein [Bacilli bacterium PM5-9]